MATEVTTRPPEISFLRQDVPPPGALYVSPEDIVGLEVATSVAGLTLELRGRQLLPNGQLTTFVETVAPTSDRLSNGFVFRIGESFLLNCTLNPVQNARQGACYARISLRRGTTPGLGVVHAVLAQGYVTTFRYLSWPPGVHELPADGAGFLRMITGTDPAAGIEISETVPTNARWLLRSVLFTLVTSAAAANRRVYLSLTDGTTEFFTLPSQDLQVASETQDYSWGARLGYERTAPVAGGINLGIPLVPLGEGYVIRTVTGALQAGDNYGAPRLLVEEWIEF